MKYPASKEEISEFKKRIAEIVAQIEDEDDKKLIQDITKYSYETPIKKQLKKLFDDNDIINILNISGVKQKSLIHTIGEYRNRLTHPDKEDSAVCDRLVYITHLLKGIVFVILVKHLKLNQEIYAYSKVTSNLKFNYLRFVETKGNIK